MSQAQEQEHNIIRLLASYCDERETSRLRNRVAPGAAITGNGAILLPSHAVERDKTVATDGGSLERTSEG